MNAFLLLIALSAHPAAERSYSEAVEVNTVCDEFDGTEKFTQVIWWDWNPRARRYVVCDWRFLKYCSGPLDLETIFVTTCRDQKGLRREVRSFYYWRTTSFFDPEQADLKVWPEDKRRKLFDSSIITYECE